MRKLHMATIKNQFEYEVTLIPLPHIPNKPQDEFRKDALAIPYLLYEVDIIHTGAKIAINKPGGKKNFGRFAKDDFMVFLVEGEHPSKLTLLSHKNIEDDLDEKFQLDKRMTKKLIQALLDICNGSEVESAIEDHELLGCFEGQGLDYEAILKTYKWIWAQEDCNYPKGEGRWKSMNYLKDKYLSE